MCNLLWYLKFVEINKINLNNFELHNLFLSVTAKHIYSKNQNMIRIMQWTNVNNYIQCLYLIENFKAEKCEEYKQTNFMWNCNWTKTLIWTWYFSRFRTRLFIFPSGHFLRRPPVIQRSRSDIKNCLWVCYITPRLKIINCRCKTWNSNLWVTTAHWTLNTEHWTQTELRTRRNCLVLQERSIN